MSMKMLEFYDRVIETSGLEVMTLGSLKASIKNCMADLTSRGYKNFIEKRMQDLKPNVYNGLIELSTPTDIRKTLYMKVFFKNNAVKAIRYSLTNPRIQCTKVNNLYLSIVPANSAVFYIKDDKMYLEWDVALGEVEEIFFGYYARLTAPDIPDTILESSDVDVLKNYKIEIREEFEDALVFYSCYFYYARYLKDTEKMQFFLNQYKYYVEDIIHEISYEDDFYEEDAVIKVDSYE